MVQQTNNELAQLIKSEIKRVEQKVDLYYEQDRQAHDSLNMQFTKLNGQVTKNTSFRDKGGIVFGILATLGIAVIGLILERIF